MRTIGTDLCVENIFHTKEYVMGIYCFSRSIYIHCIWYIAQLWIHFWYFWESLIGRNFTAPIPGRNQIVGPRAWSNPKYWGLKRGLRGNLHPLPQSHIWNNVEFNFFFKSDFEVEWGKITLLDPSSVVQFKRAKCDFSKWGYFAPLK